MSKLLNSGQVGNFSFKNLQEQRKAIAKNWKDSGLLDGLTGGVKENITQLYEQQAAVMLHDDYDDKVKYHTRRYEEEMNKRFYTGASIHLQFLIEAIQKELYKNYC